MIKYFCLAVSILITFEVAHNAAGQGLVHRSFDQLFAGDDPGELFRFDLAFDPFVPTVVRFNGHFENLAVNATDQDHLGINLAPTDYSQEPWTQEAGPTVFAPFPHDTDYLGTAEKQWMINFRGTSWQKSTVCRWSAWTTFGHIALIRRGPSPSSILKKHRLS